MAKHIEIQEPVHMLGETSSDEAKALCGLAVEREVDGDEWFWTPKGKKQLSHQLVFCTTSYYVTCEKCRRRMH